MYRVRDFLIPETDAKTFSNQTISEVDIFQPVVINGEANTKLDTGISSYSGPSNLHVHRSMQTDLFWYGTALTESKE